MDSSSGEYVCKTEFETSDVVLGFLLTIGIVLSFLPQIFVIIFRKNVEGLSVIMCWLNYVNCMGTFVNVLFLNWFIFECTWLDSWNIFRNLLPTIQLAPPFLCSLVIFILYVIYRPKMTTNIADKQNNGEISKIIQDGSKQVNYTNSNSIINNNNNNNNNHQINNSIDDNMSISVNTDGIIDFDNNNNNNNRNNSSNSVSSSASSSGSSSPILAEKPLLPHKPKSKVDEFILKMDWHSQPFFWGSIVLSLILFGIGVALVYSYGSKSETLKNYSFGCGIFALVLVFLQWLPQIYTTIITNEIGSLSLVSVCIQAPGSFLVMFFQIQSKQNWSTWVPYLASGIQMCVLIGICVYYLIRDRKKNKLLKEEKKKSNNNNSIDINNNNNNNQALPPPENYQNEINNLN